MELQFIDPPPSASRRVATVFTGQVLDALRERPGEWALIGRYSPGTGSNFTKRHPDFQATTRANKGGKADIYVRYVGESA